MTYPVAEAPVPAPRKRTIWPWIVGGAAALVLLVIGVGLGVVLIAAAQKEADLEAVEQTVRSFDASYEELDCDLFEEVTAEELRDELYEPDGYDCDDWEQNAEKFFDDDGDYTFDVEVESVTVTGDRARVETSESWQSEGTPYSATVTYRLERQDGAWIITGYKDVLDESDQPAADPDPAPEEDCGNSDEDGCAEPTADEVVAEDLKNAKAALMAYYLVEGGWAGMTPEELSPYGYDPSLGTLNMQYYVDETQEEPTYCIDASSSETGNSFWIRQNTVATAGLCSDPVE